MSDSESDTSNNVFNFQNSTTVNARGPNTNFSFRYPMTSTMHMSRNFERPRYAESAYDQKSMYYRRETSPMSIQSACDMRQRSFQQYTGMSSRHSVYTGRGGSPMSMRSIDSSASVSAADIAFAFNNGKFNRNDWRLIREAYQKFLKQRVRKRIEKRRNMRLHLKSRRRSGEDSGDQASDSSVSSDDRRSVRTYKENMSSNRSSKTDLCDFRNTFRDRITLKESSTNFCQSTFKNKFSVGSSIVNNAHNFNNTVTSNQSNAMPTQKDRFRNGFLLPSHRFNRSVASSAIMEDSGKPHKNTGKNVINNVRNNCPSSEEEIFSTTVREKSAINIEMQRKRSLDSDDESRPPDSKRSRVTSPAKNKQAPPKKNINPSTNNVDLSNSFQFAKPSLPVRKSKHQVQEKLIAKSSQPLTDFLEPMPSKIQENVQVLETTNSKEKSNDSLSLVEQSDTTQNSDISSRPSFIKRKLFTQKLDVAEKANLSTDGTSSPQSSVHTLQKEKNKARKLVTNQSCLNREVQEDQDNDLLDLIHKIVPPDRINISNQTTISQTKNDVNNKKDNDTKWDVTSVISMCNEDDASDTYTDEEIFKSENTIKHTAKNKDVNTKANPIDKVVTKTPLPQEICKVMLQKLENTNILQKQVVNQNFNITHNNITKNNAKNSGKSFWDTDFESDAECHTVLPRIHVIDNLKKANATLDNTKQDFKNPSGYTGNEISKSFQVAEVPKHLNNSSMNNTTFNNTHKLKATLSVRSHRTSKKKKGLNETCVNATKPNLDNPGDKNCRNNIGMTNLKPNLQSKNSTEISKSTLNEKITTVVRSQSPKSNKKAKSKSKLEKTSANSEKSNPEPQTNKTATKKKLEKQNENTQVKNDHKAKTQNENTQVKNDHKTKTQNENTQVKNDHKAKTPNENTQVKNDHKAKTQNENTQVKSDNKAKTQNETTQGKNNHKAKTQNENTQVKNDHKAKTQSENTQVKNDHKARTQNENTQVKNDHNKANSHKQNQQNKKQTSPKSKPKSKQPQHQNEKQSKKNKSVLKPINSNLNNTVEAVQSTSFISGRPIRSCRTPSQNRSELNNTSLDMSKSLRSRVINLSSSIENITIKIKTKNKNKNISLINPRNSDVSFSLRSREQTPVSKMTARNRADQRKRKT